MLRIYCLLDTKLREFGQLVLERNEFVVQRALLDGIKAQPEAMLAKHPEDFQLYCVGEFNAESGVINRLDAPRLVANVSDLVQAGASSPGRPEPTEVLRSAFGIKKAGVNDG